MTLGLTVAVLAAAPKLVVVDPPGLLDSAMNEAKLEWSPGDSALGERLAACTTDACRRDVVAGANVVTVTVRRERAFDVAEYRFVSAAGKEQKLTQCSNYEADEGAIYARLAQDFALLRAGKKQVSSSDCAVLKNLPSPQDSAIAGAEQHLSIWRLARSRSSPRPQHPSLDDFRRDLDSLRPFTDASARAQTLWNEIYRIERELTDEGRRRNALPPGP